MPKFAYQAINENGATVSGVIEAESPESANNMLVAGGYIPARISKADTFSEEGFLARLKSQFGSVSAPELILFTKQFRTMLLAGIPIIRLLQVLEAQTQNPNLKKAIAQMAMDIKQGSTLVDALEKQPKIFSPLYRSMINAGEVSGTVPDVLERLSYILEHEFKVKSDVKAALQYPVIVLIALSVAFVVLLTFVIPKFVGIFAKAGVALPFPTKVAMMLYQFLHNYWYIVIVAVIAIIVGLRQYFRTEKGSLARDAFLLRIPLFGPLFNKAAMSRFASIFSILQSSGVQIMTTMKVLIGTIGNTAIAREFENIQDMMQKGQGIAGPLRKAKYFPPMVVDMVAIGEESGNIEEMMKVISVHYDEEVAYQVKRLSDLIGPILVVGLAAVVGFFALAIFLPMWDLTKMVK
ncbi:MAG TPA: type II secretion system F family protein [Syntrophales bacterium]|nr:type II secretion system F family protein [Syntrophales bacterium]